MLLIYEVRLTADERQFLRTFVHKGTCTVNTLTRAHILLAADANRGTAAQADDAIAQVVNTSASTVHRVRKRFAEQGLLAALLANRPRPRRPLLPGMNV